MSEIRKKLSRHAIGSHELDHCILRVRRASTLLFNQQHESDDVQGYFYVIIRSGTICITAFFGKSLGECTILHIYILYQRKIAPTIILA